MNLVLALALLSAVQLQVCEDEVFGGFVWIFVAVANPC